VHKTVGNNATILDAVSHIDSLKTKLVAIKQKLALRWQNSLKAMMTKTSTIIKVYKLYKMTVTLKNLLK